MIKVILIGSSGRMGKVLTSFINESSDMEVAAGIDLVAGDGAFPVYQTLKECKESADVIIDFSNPATLAGYLDEAAVRKIPAVIATTGLSDDDLKWIKKVSESVAIFRSANMSLGINLLQQLVKTAATVLGNAFDIEIVEKHHKMKKDAPSGTAFMLADSINEALDNSLEYVNGRSGKDCQRKTNELGIHAVRGGTIVGEHDVFFAGADEIITIGHSANSRNVFATGAIAAARFLADCPPGQYNMQDIINKAGVNK